MVDDACSIGYRCGTCNGFGDIAYAVMYYALFNVDGIIVSCFMEGLDAAIHRSAEYNICPDQKTSYHLLSKYDRMMP